MNYSKCEFFNKVETDYDVITGHSSYTCFCNRHRDNQEIVPELNCKRCDMLRKKEYKKVVNVDDIFYYLAKADKSKYVRIARLYRFSSFLSKNSSEYTYDVTRNSIDRMLMYGSMVYDLIEDIIVIKGVLPCPQELNDTLESLANKFASLYPLHSD